MDKGFFKVVSVGRCHELAGELIGAVQAEVVGLGEAHGRVLAEDVRAPEDVPGFSRSTVDGYAVRARDTFGASEQAPVYLRLVGEVAMGQRPRVGVGREECVGISTGGMLPDGADAVVMLEHTRVVEGAMVEVVRPVAPGVNVIERGEDAAEGELLLPAGRRLRAQDLGLAAAMGVVELAVRRRPRVGIISTGEELVGPEERPGPGQVRDVNTYTLGALVREAGGEAVVLGRVGDEPRELGELIAKGLEGCEMVLVSGGSSVGRRDITLEVFSAVAGARVVVHGVAVSPGKPFIWVEAGGRQLVGLPGQVASCVVAFYVLVEPMIERLLGRPARAFRRFARVRARMGRALGSAPGREEYVRVRLRREDGGWVAEPELGASGLIRTLVRGVGLVRIGRDEEGLAAGEEVEVMLFPGQEVD